MFKQTYPSRSSWFARGGSLYGKPVTHQSLLRMGIVLVILTAMLSACGGQTPVVEQPTSEPTLLPTSTVPAPSAVPETSAQPVRSMTDVPLAVFRIEVEGEFRYLNNEQLESTNTGTGFFINEDGLAITNIHIINGGSLLRVYTEDEEGYRNARVVALSECSDLALIQVDGEVKHYFDWYDQASSAGLPIYVSGFPLGSQYIKTVEGIVSTAKGNGQTSWASIKSVIEHTANTLPGHSGSPVFTQDTFEVVGVNYAGNRHGQHFAINADLVRSLIDGYRESTRLETIGINGEAFSIATEAGDVSGIWVVSVRPGSPASRAKVLPGDILYSMNNLLMAKGGTMQGYCDVLRSLDYDAVIPIEVYRPDMKAVLKGELNGDVLSPVAPPATPTAIPQPTATQVASHIKVFTLSDQQQQEQQARHRQRMGLFQQVFFEDFQNPKSRTRWPQNDDATYGRALVNNVYRLTLKQSLVENKVLWNEDTVDASYAVELTVLPNDGANGTSGVGIAFGDDQRGNYSVFVVRNDHTWQIVTMKQGQVAPLYSTAPIPERHLTQGVNSNILWVVRTPEMVEFWINAALVAVGPAEMATGPYVGVVGISADDSRGPISVDVDSFLLWKPK